jgi:DNA-binding NtrC family response regulator
LNVVPVPLPPLRARRDDIPLLVQDFLRRYVAEYDRPEVRLSGAAMQSLRDYEWPGNVRELQNLIERLVSLSAGGEIDAGDLPEEMTALRGLAANGADPPIASPDRPFHEAKADAIAWFEKAYLLALLARNGGNISQAARQAGIDRKTIHRMLVKYEMDDARA